MRTHTRDTHTAQNYKHTRMHQRTLTPTYKPTYTLLDKGWPGTSMQPRMERWSRGREGGVEGRSGPKRRGDEIEGPPAEVLMHLLSVRPDGGALALNTMSS